MNKDAMTPGKENFCINTQPALLASEIARVIQESTPGEQDLVAVQRQLLYRHAILRLAKRTAPEETIESFFRCLLTDHLQRQYKINIAMIPRCISSSHTATRGICVADSDHNHQCIEETEWKKAWNYFQHQHPEVNIYIPGKRRARRADLYLAAQGGIVSIEFKYIGNHGSLNIKDCADQMRGYVEHHAATMLVIYSGSNDRRTSQGMDQLCNLLGPAVNVILVNGPAIPPVIPIC
jgi:hypothetical protein